MTIRNSVRGLMTVSALLSSFVVFAVASSAGAAGSNYGGSPPPNTVPGPTGGSFPVSAVLTTTGKAQQTTATVGSTSLSISLPAGILPAGDQMIVANAAVQPPPPGEQHVVTLFVGVYNGDTKFTGSFAHPVMVTIHSSSIHAGDMVMQFISGKWQPLVAQVVNGVATVAITEDPVIDVVHPPLATVAAIVRSVVTVKFGSTGPSVKRAQVLLNRHGAKLAVDGIFGPKTLAAVKAFQSRSGLAKSGVVTSSTWKELAL